MAKLSASRIKTLDGCSWIYWATYVLKVPTEENTGAILGSCCHEILEDLADVKNYKLYEKILGSKTIKKTKYLTFAKKFLAEKNISVKDLIPDKDRNPVVCLDLIDRMILTALEYDFHGEGAEEKYSEKEFDIKTDNYHINGFIDRLFIYKDRIVIRDYKSSKQKFTGADFEDNVQDLIYKLAVKHMFPDFESNTEFIFLQHDDCVVRTPSTCNQELKGFEFYLSNIQSVIDNFTEEVACSNFAKDHGFKSSYHGFSGLLKCGTAVTPFETKADGNPKWFCPFKFARHYYVLLRKGEIVASANEESKLLKEEGDIIEKRLYSGCPAWPHLKYNKNYV